MTMAADIGISSSILETIQGLFSEKLIYNNQEEGRGEPVAIFPRPFGGSNDDVTTTKFAVYPPRWEYWKQMVYLNIIQTFIQCAFAVAIYCLIVKKRNTTSSYLIGYGVIIPLAVFYLPYQLLELLNIQNKALKFSINPLPVLVFFRTIEAMHATSCDADIVESSLTNYVAYYSSLPHYEWDYKTKLRKVSSTSLLFNTFKRIVMHYHIVCLILSFEMQYSYQPFDSNVRLEAFHSNLIDILSPSHLANCYCLALLTFYMLSLSFEITAFAENLKGFQTKPVFSNPMFTSHSVSEFWSKKWNLVIHRMLKHGVYLPARLRFKCSNLLSIMLTFLVSGLLHEYSWSVIYYTHKHKLDENGNCLDCWYPQPIKLVCFFLWNGIIMLLLERTMLAKYFTKLTAKLPTIIVSTMVVLLGLPVSHWFTGDWAIGGLYEDFSYGVWYIKKL